MIGIEAGNPEVIVGQLQQAIEAGQRRQRQAVREARTKGVLLLGVGLIGVPAVVVGGWFAASALLSGLGVVTVGWFAHLIVSGFFWSVLGGVLGAIMRAIISA